ncbi:Uncharacterised protein [Escherichia coli]|nr:Uncharacterised protein [Escherichia coli]
MVYGKQAVIGAVPALRQAKPRHAVVVHPGLRRLFFRGVATVGFKNRQISGNPGGVAPFVEGLRDVSFRHDNGIFRGNRQAGETERRRFAEVTACFGDHFRQRVFLFQQKWERCRGTGDRACL